MRNPWDILFFLDHSKTSQGRKFLLCKVMSKASDGVGKARCSSAIPARARSRESSTQFPQAADAGYLCPKQPGQLLGLQLLLSSNLKKSHSRKCKAHLAFQTTMDDSQPQPKGVCWKKNILDVYFLNHHFFPLVSHCLSLVYSNSLCINKTPP